MKPSAHKCGWNATNKMNIILKFSPSTSQRHTGGAEILLQSFLTPVLVGGKRLPWSHGHFRRGTLGRSGRFCARAALPQGGGGNDVHLIGLWVGPGTALDGLAENTLQLPARELQETSSVSIPTGLSWLANKYKNRSDGTFSCLHLRKIKFMPNQW